MTSSAISSIVHEEYMKRAIKLAERGRGFTDPNPVVGAVIVKDGKIIGEGWHERYGELHAERNAIADCIKRGNDPQGADIYVTLEPCCHHGQTPPCTDALIENRIGHVYIGSNDPNPLVSEKSSEILTSAGIGQTRGILKEECDALNVRFFHYITTGLPFVTADGKIASATGKSQWITGEEARAHVHMLRHKYAGIMVGIGTVLADDPMLNCRMEGGSDPVRIIMDSRLSIPLESKIVQTAKEIRTIIVTSEGRPTASHIVSSGEGSEDSKTVFKDDLLKASGCEIIKVGTEMKEGGTEMLDIKETMKKLAEMKISSILVEGGSTLAYSVIESGVVNRVAAFVAPKILGGSRAKSPVGGIGFDDPNCCLNMHLAGILRFGEDIMLKYDVL
jgi:diaminohydroxyphosphoribosylaminopyrimidine deaminase/5-amino-6-(5-phosphoribosylamino)uracil reductase